MNTESTETQEKKPETLEEATMMVLNEDWRDQFVDVQEPITRMDRDQEFEQNKQLDKRNSEIANTNKHENQEIRRDTAGPLSQKIGEFEAVGIGLIKGMYSDPNKSRQFSMQLMDICDPVSEEIYTAVRNGKQTNEHFQKLVKMLQQAYGVIPRGNQDPRIRSLGIDIMTLAKKILG